MSLLMKEREEIIVRSYLDIIIDLKDGLKPDYEEVRLACLMANDLLFFADQDIKRLTGYGTDKEKDDVVYKIIYFIK